MMEFAHKAHDLAGLDRIIVLTGPTGVGKTRLSLEVARSLDAEIVSVDSVQVYRHLDIGTAKVSAEVRAQIPHHLIDVVRPDEEFNVADFKRLASAAIGDILGRGKAVLLVGGTGMYIRLLVHGIFEAPEPSAELRANYQRQAEEHGRETLHKRLQQVDPQLAEKLHPNDLVRVSRGLEIFDQTGKALSVHQQEHRFKTPNYHALKLVLIRPRAELYERINARVDRMVEAGLEAEYRELLRMGYGPEDKPMQSLGYRQMGEYVAGQSTLEEALESMKIRTRRYAKQQISWFRGEPGARWVMAPVLRGGELPGVVLRDLRAFLDGEEPDLEWANIDPYNVER